MNRRLPAILLWACTLASCRAPARDLTVFAAASLREAMADLADAYAAQHPGCHVTLQFAGSQELRTQLQHGALADVIATADEASMATLVADGVAHAPDALTCNTPVVALAIDVTTGLQFNDLPQLDRIVLGTPDVPIGRYADEILARADPAFAAAVRAHVVSREANARQVLAKVTLGEAQAAIVYRTDALAAGANVRTLAVPSALGVVARYRIAAGNGPLQTDAAAFVALARSAVGQSALARRGFVACP